MAAPSSVGAGGTCVSRASALGEDGRGAGELAGRYRSWLQDHPEAELADVCYTAGVGRSHFERRAAVLVESREQAQTALQALQEGQSNPGLFVGHGGKAKVAWLFTGQGSQYVGMARRLYESQPLFRGVLD